jgi:antirestriction protein
MSKDNCNHCPALRQSAESSVRLELRLKEALEHISLKEHEQLDCIVKIKSLESEKAELIKILKREYGHFCLFKYCSKDCKQNCTDKNRLYNDILKYEVKP